LLTSFAYAEEAAHHEASVWDLKYPFVNFIIFLAILSKVIKPLREKFNKEAMDIKSLMDSASRNSQDAQEKLISFQSKIKSLDSELIKITTDYESDAVQFAKAQSEETQTVIVRMKRDLENKLDGERKELIDLLNHDVVNIVVTKTQTTIKSNSDLKVKATQKIVSELR
jgi:F0F1-type ATP synthase membrane subunit b/b'